MHCKGRKNQRFPPFQQLIIWALPSFSVVLRHNHMHVLDFLLARHTHHCSNCIHDAIQALQGLVIKVEGQDDLVPVFLSPSDGTKESVCVCLQGDKAV